MINNPIFKYLFFTFVAIILLLSVFLVIKYFAASSQNDDIIVESNKMPEQISNKPMNVSKPKGERNAKLQAETDGLLLLFDKMPSVPVYLSNEPIQGGTNVEGGVAYNVCEDHKNPTIYVKKAFYAKANRKQLVNILKHELTHAYFCRQGIQAGHDERFRQKFTQVGGFGN